MRRRTTTPARPDDAAGQSRQALLKFAPGTAAALRIPHARASSTDVASAAIRLFGALKPHHKLLASAGYSKDFLLEMRADGKLITHSRLRSRFSDVCPIWPRPSMQLQPSHHTEDIGARFAVPSSLRLLIPRSARDDVAPAPARIEFALAAGFQHRRCRAYFVS